MSTFTFLSPKTKTVANYENGFSVFTKNGTEVIRIKIEEPTSIADHRAKVDAVISEKDRVEKINSAK